MPAEKETTIKTYIVEMTKIAGLKLDDNSPAMKTLVEA